MKDVFLRFMREEDGAGTVEVIVIVAVLVGVALLFRRALWHWVNDMLENLLPDQDQFDNRSNVIDTKQ